jgi:signal transduction histidine kinase
VIKRLRSLGEQDWRTLDRVLAVVMTLALEINVLTASAVEGQLVLNLLVSVPMGLAMLERRRRPLVAMSVYVFFATIATVWLTGPPDLAIAVLILIMLSYSTGAHLETRRSWIGLAISGGTVVTLTLIYDANDVFFPTVFFSLLPWFVGRVIRGQTLLARELAEKAERAEHERELGEARAIAEERRRVARELHDVLAHDLSVMVVQASAARRIADANPQAAGDAARLIERTGREALAELRHLFGPVRRGEGEELGAPGLARVDRLAERARHAGLPVELRIEGERRELPPGIDLAAYRVIQEALTNSLKHAGPARADVLVRYSPAMLTLEINDDGVGPNGSESAVAPGGGHGLVGMRERVALYGGDLEAGRRRGGGFAVRATLPVNGGGG